MKVEFNLYHKRLLVFIQAANFIFHSKVTHSKFPQEAGLSGISTVSYKSGNIFTTTYDASHENSPALLAFIGGEDAVYWSQQPVSCPILL